MGDPEDGIPAGMVDRKPLAAIIAAVAFTASLAALLDGPAALAIRTMGVGFFLPYSWWLSFQTSLTLIFPHKHNKKHPIQVLKR